MDRLNKLTLALRNAQKVGDTNAARRLDGMISEQKSLEQGGRDQNVGGVFDAFTKGATFGLGPKFTAGEASLLGRTPDGDFFNYDQSFGERYDAALEAERGQNTGFAKENPATALTAEIAGGLTSAAGVGRTLARKGVTALKGGLSGAGGRLGSKVGLQGTGRVAGAATEGAGIGASYAFGADEDVGDGALMGAAFGVGGNLIGRGLQGAGRGIAEASRRSGLLKEAPSQKLLRKGSEDAYEAAEKSGIRFKSDYFSDWVSNLTKEMMSKGARANLTNKTMAVLEEYKALIGTSPTFKQMNELRQIAGHAAGALEPAEKRLGVMIINSLDDFVESGSSTLGKQAKQARNLWGRVRRDELLEKTIEKAGRNPSGIEKGLRTQFRQLINNEKKMRGFSDFEKQAIERIAKGTGTGNVLRAIGNLGFDPQKTVSNMISGGIGVAGTLAAGFGPVGVVAQQGVSYAARKAGEVLAKRNAEVLRAMVRSGKNDVEISKVMQALEKAGNNEELAASIIRATGITGSR